MIVHAQKSDASFARHAARSALSANNNVQNIQPSTQKKGSVKAASATATATEIDKIVVSVENATKRLSQVSTNTNSSKRKSKNHVGPWRLGRTLGRGSTGRVRLAKHAETGQLAAVKIVPKSRFQKDGASEEKDSSSPYGIEREIIIMKLISHENIMGLYDVWENKGELYLVLEYVEGGELFDYLIKKGKLPEKEAVHYFRQIISGVSYCHQFNICHRDLKPENLLLDKDMNIKIADFGMAALEINHKLLETSCGSPHYASPEIVTGKNYHGSPSDVWSCGIILFALLTGHLPFDDENIRKLLTKVQSGRFVMPNYLSSDAKDLIWKMLNVNPNQRIRINDIFKHPLMKKYETAATARDSLTDKKKMNDYYGEVNNLQIKREEIDRDIIKSLSILFHGATEANLIPKLVSTQSTPEKMFYFLLYKYKKQHQIKEKQDAVNKSKKKIGNGDGMLKKSKSMVKTTITNEDGTTKITTEAVEMPPLPATPKKKVVKNAAGHIQISASSSYRRGVSFNNMIINNSMSRSSSKRSIPSIAQQASIIKKHQSILPPLPDLEIDWLNIGPGSGPSPEFASLYNEIFSLRSPAKTPKTSPKKSFSQKVAAVEIPARPSNTEKIRHASPMPRLVSSTSPQPVTEAVPIVNDVGSSTQTRLDPGAKVLPRQMVNFELNRRNASQPTPQSKSRTLDPNYKFRSISNDNAQVLQRFGVSLKREKKTNSKIFYSKSSTSINLAAILKSAGNSVLGIPSDAPPLPQHRISSSNYASFEDKDQGLDESPSSYGTTHDSSFDFELPATTEVATMVPIANGSDVTVHKSNKQRDESMFADVNLSQENFLKYSGSDQSVIKHHKKASSNLTQVVPPSLDIRGSLFNNPSDLRDGSAVPRLESFTRHRISHFDEHNETKSTIMDNSLFADNTDDDLEYGGAKRVTMLFDDPQEWEMDGSSILEPEVLKVDHKPIRQSSLKQIQDQDFKATPSGTFKKDLRPQRLAPSAPDKSGDGTSIPVKKSNWFTKFFSSLISSSTYETKRSPNTTTTFRCSVPLPILKKAIKVALELKRKEGTLSMITDSQDCIRATVPRAYTLGKPLRFQINFEYETRQITLEKLKGSKNLFRNLSNALEFVIENETQRFNESELI